VKHGNFKELERQLLEVSDPTHHLYGNHLSQADVHALIAPSQNAIEAVHDWLEDNGIHPDQLRYTPAKDWVMIELPISKVEDLLDTEYHVYENDAGTTIVRTAEYSLPKSLHEHIDTIQPTNYFSDHKAMADLAIKPERHELSGTDLLSVGVSIGLSIGSEPEEEPPSTSNNASAVCKKLYKSPNCLRTLYNTIDYVPQVPQLNSAGTTNFANESSNHSDFTVYMSQFRKDAGKDYQFNVEIVADGIDMQDREKKYLGVRDYEGNLDVQVSPESRCSWGHC
jgi:tripeptidyl-peptidase-1